MKYQEKYLVRTSNLDFNQELSLNSIMRFFLETAFNHEGFIKASKKSYNRDGLSWIVYKWMVEFKTGADLGETLYVDTWLSKIDRFMIDRCFELTNSKGEILARAKSVWNIVDHEKKSLMRIPKAMKLDYDIVKDDLFPEDRRLEKLDESLEYTLDKREVLFYDIDSNLHMNNLAYINKVLDTIPFNLLKEKRINYTEIVYKRELLLGDKYKVKTALVPGTELEILSQVESIDGNKEYARALIRLD